jgi:hypothetical protein
MKDIGVEVRGQSSQMFPKKSMDVNFLKPNYKVACAVEVSG